MNRSDPEFSRVCVEACNLAIVYGDKDLAVEFTLCDNENRFLRLCDKFETYNNGNPIGESFQGKIRELRQVNNIVEMLDIESML